MKKIEINSDDYKRYYEIIATVATEESYTAYGVSTILNIVLAANDLELVRSQMMYNYARNGLIVSEKIFGATLRNFTRDEVIAFVVRYCVRNHVEIKVAKATETNSSDYRVMF